MKWFAYSHYAVIINIPNALSASLGWFCRLLIHFIIGLSYLIHVFGSIDSYIRRPALKLQSVIKTLLLFSGAIGPFPPRDSNLADEQCCFEIDPNSNLPFCSLLYREPPGSWSSTPMRFRRRWSPSEPYSWRRNWRRTISRGSFRGEFLRLLWMK